MTLSLSNYEHFIVSFFREANLTGKIEFLHRLSNKINAILNGTKDQLKEVKTALEFAQINQTLLKSILQYTPLIEHHYIALAFKGIKYVLQLKEKIWSR